MKRWIFNNLLRPFRDQIVEAVVEALSDRLDYGMAYVAEEAAEAANQAGDGVVKAYSSMRRKAGQKLFAQNPDLVIVYPLLKRAMLQLLEGQSVAAKAAKVQLLIQKMQSLTPTEAETLTRELVDHAVVLIRDRFEQPEASKAIAAED